MTASRASQRSAPDPGRFTEDDLLDLLRTLLSGPAPGVLLGPGDDAALVDMGPHLAILTADMLVEGVHFERAATSPRDLGHKALTVNVSDVAAMGGSPRYALVSLGVAPDVEVPWIVELYGGLRDAAAEHAMSIVGGDVSRSEGVVVSVAVTGEVARGKAALRSGARPGDRMVVTGTLGAAAGGLRLSRAPSGVVGEAVGADWGRHLATALSRPVARLGEGQTLVQCGATAMMDLSDGLAKDLSRLCRESGVGAAVRLSAVPVADALTPLAGLLQIDPLDLALHGGEDYELLATLPPEAVPRAKVTLRDRFATSLTDVGEIREEEGLLAILDDGSERELEPAGWDHLAG